jgi:hypothetical protein
LTTDKFGRGNRAQVDLSSVVPWENVSGEEIPAYGVVQLRTNFSTDSKASKPNATSGLFFVNGPAPVAASGRGESHVWDKPRRVLTDGTLQVGDEIGPVPGQWYMSTEGSGWRVLHQPVSSIAVVVQIGSGGGGGHTIWFTIEDVLCPETDYTEETILVVTAEWYTGGCTGTPPDANYDGTYNVYDICNYLYGLTPTELIGTKGRATYHYPLTGYCEPKWLIDDLCAQPEC